MTLKTRLKKLEQESGAIRPNMTVQEMSTAQLEALIRKNYGLPKDAEITTEMLRKLAEGENANGKNED